jgi:hypothetical protein
MTRGNGEYGNKKAGFFVHQTQVGSDLAEPLQAMRVVHQWFLLRARR